MQSSTVKDGDFKQELEWGARKEHSTLVSHETSETTWPTVLQQNFGSFVNTSFVKD